LKSSLHLHVGKGFDLQNRIFTEGFDTFDEITHNYVIPTSNGFQRPYRRRTCQENVRYWSALCKLEAENNDQKTSKFTQKEGSFDPANRTYRTRIIAFDVFLHHTG
jgi:hypothetical protein